MKIELKKTIFLILLLVSYGMRADGQINKKKKANSDTETWRYELECVGIGKPGTKVVKVWSYSKKQKIAIDQAKKNAVHGIMFRGYAAGGRGCTSQKPIINEPAVEQQKETFFGDFFSDGGKYMKFVTYSGDATPTPVKVGKEYKIGVVVTLLTNNLRRDLEDAGIIKKLSSGF